MKIFVIRIFSLLSFLFLLASCSKDPATETNLTSPPEIDTGALPYIRITTDVSIENEPKVAGDMAVFENQSLSFRKLGITTVKMSMKVF